MGKAATPTSALINTHLGRMVYLTLLSGLVLLVLELGYNVRSVADLYRSNASYSLGITALRLPVDDHAATKARLQETLSTQPYTTLTLRDETGQIIAGFKKPWTTPVPDWALLLLPDWRKDVVQTIPNTTLSLHATLDVGQLSAQVSENLKPLALLTMGWVIGFTLLLSFRVLRRVTQPIERLAMGLSRVNPLSPGKTLLPIPPEHEHDEIGEVMRATNQLLVRLEQGFKRDREHVKDLAERETFLREILDNVAEGIAYIGHDRRIVRANKTAAHLFEYSEESLNNLEFSTLLAPSDRPLFNARLSKLAAGAVDENSNTLGFDSLGQKRDGTHLNLNMIVTRIGEVGNCAFILVFRDVGETRRAQETIKQNESRLRLAVKATRCCVWDHDLVANAYWWSPEFLPMLGYSESELPASLDTKFSLIHPEDIEWVKTSKERYLKRETADYSPEYRMCRKDGSWMWVEDRGTAEWDTSGAAVRFSGTMTDCSERKRFEKQLMYMATHDPMTDLPNRTLLQDRLEHSLISSLRSGLQVAVLLIDIDRFKLINDSLGHDIGDQLIRAVALRLQQSLRPTDTLAHLSADEFVVICEDLPSPQEAARIAKRLLNALAQPFLVDSNQLNISISIGISVSPSDGKTGQDILRHADTAMHSAKAGGGGGYRFFVPEMNREAVERLTMERNLNEAIERQIFLLHYQPKIDIATGKMVSAEALIRWPHRGQGYISPMQFIPVAEETGLIISIGEWVLREALSQICIWRDRGLDLVPIAVNLSGKQLMTSGIDEMILRLLREYDVPPHLLEVEITESSLIARMDKVLPPLHRLREAGVGIALDDFGTGYSSLSWLRQLPITSLKIDRSFIKDIPNKEEANAIVAIILEIGRQLHLKVVAEGIETEEQNTFLRQHRCDVGQGWLFHRALPAAAFEKLMTKIAQKED